ncbi:RsiW-degrading membrane proteinase PrsW (M82 family) [Microbacterium resistens]|uniref:RsiW-degrading membrane proteinase PrsW (M82 family) n=1 Tax=Microbacterium resistens TaxID=156977 RepID=A0ABU1SGB0_9MICO|nr:PrsW family intramembrane metalloprotease [Microbacterium resistens]MDR6868636.1 RsiW-degrading membrane proteinase PrsW (M82 family) [Microbacterium resistens]
MSFGGPYDPVRPEDGAGAPVDGAAGYAPPVYGSVLAQRPETAAQPVYRPPAPVPTVPSLPVPARRGRAAVIWALGLLGFVLIALVGYFVGTLGAAASVIGLVLALIPLGIVLFGVRLIDRWEPEPRSLVVFALAWGALAAVGIALLVDLGLTTLLGQRDDTLTSILQAPIVEEGAKGLGVLLVFLMARRAFDGPVDGIVYGALVGAGFAFTENIQYFAVSLIEGGGQDLTVTFVLRGLMSPFAHAMFTSLTGFAIGMAARRGGTLGAVSSAGLVGLVGAVLLHAFWNGSSVFGDFFALYLTAQVPLFIGFILGIVGLRREESRLTRERLSEYAAAGWFTPQEVTMLATPAGRRAGLQWARGLREDRRPVMKAFIKEATALAAVRQRIIGGRDAVAIQDERALLLRAQATRAELLAY